jgi:uncharacterized protein YndB with AHSA1/START domain
LSRCDLPCLDVQISFVAQEEKVMARFVDAIDLPLEIEVAFDYMADFSRTAEWDPGVAEARRLTPDPIGAGSRFEVIVAFAGRRIPFEYVISEFDRPHRIVLEAADSSLHSTDEITFTQSPSGTRMTYEARLELSGAAMLADPLLDVLLQRIGRLAVRGLRERLARDMRERPSHPPRVRNTTINEVHPDHREHGAA